MSGLLEDAGLQAAETIQTAHIRHHPSIEHDIAPSTAADTKHVVELDPNADGIDSDVDEDEIPVSILRSAPRKPQMPPLPDLRFEQSYLASIKNAQSWQGVAFITIKDQVFMPLAQGMLWNLIVAGWRHWNGATKFKGQTAGARLRRWWWEVNNWRLPETKSQTKSHR